MSEPSIIGTARIARAFVRGIYPLLNEDTLAPGDFAPAARALAEAGITVMQLRLKSLADGDRLAIQRGVLEVLRGWQGIFVIDDRADLVRIAVDDAAGQGPAIGLHLGQHDLPPGLARAIVGPDVVIGLSTHNAGQVVAAMREPVDYLGFGPVFATATKTNPDPVTGIEGLRDACRASTLPVVAIGGIGASTLGPVAAAQAAAAAVVGLLWPTGCASDDNAALTVRVRSAMEAFR